LHGWLDLSKDFTDWIKYQVKRGMLEKDRHYQVYHKFGENPSGGRPKKEYLLSVEACKKIAMMSETKKGNEAREYFIDIEKKYLSERQTQVSLPGTYLEALKALVAQVELTERQKPKVECYDQLIDCEGYYMVEEVAKLLGYSRTTFFSLLRENGYLQHAKGKSWNLPYQRTIEKGWFVVKTNYYYHGDTKSPYTKTLVTPKGVDELTRYFGKTSKALVNA